jgi:hypothetical protein
LTDGFQRRGLKCDKLTDDRKQTTDAKWCQKPTLPLARWAKRNIKMWIPTCNVLLQWRCFFRNEPIRNKNCLWRPCLLTDRDEMSNLYRGPSIDASYQVSVHLAKWFLEKIFKNRTIRNKNCLWRSCLLTDRDEMSTLYRWPFIDASYQVSVHLTKWFRRRKLIKIGQSETRIACCGHFC